MATWEDYKKTMRSENPIFGYARTGDVDSLRFSIKPENINSEDSKGYSPLMLAAYNGHIEATRFLIDKGANIDQTDHSENTILMGASFKGHLEVVKLLVEAGASIETQNPLGHSALQFAEMFGRTDVVLFLKSKLNKPEVYGLKDIFKVWTSYFLSKAASRKNA